MAHNIWNAPLLLLLWQVAPVPIARDGSGRLHIGLAAGRGTFMHRQALNCAGEPESPPVGIALSYRSTGVAADYRVSDRVTAHAALGRVDDESGAHMGWHGAAQASLRERWFGVGGGAAVLGGTQGGLAPAGFLRLGREDLPHLRADYGFPTPVMGLTGLPRAGVAYQSRAVAVFVGAGTTPVPRSRPRVGGFADVEFRAWDGLGLLFHLVHAGNDDLGSLSGFGVGLTLTP